MIQSVSSFSSPFSSSSFSSVSFVGLGAMGWHMAAHLTQLNIPVRVWNRDAQKAIAHAAQFNTQAVDLETALSSDVVISCLPTSAIVEELLFTHALTPVKVWIDCTSGEPASAKKIQHYLSTHYPQIQYLDCPVSGQTIGAQNGTLTVMVGGSQTALQHVLPILQCFGKKIEYVGESGAGFAVKAINNLLLAINVWSASEGLLALKKAGVHLDAALRCINASSGRSLASENTLPERVLNQQFPLTFALELLAKDCAIATDLVKQAHMAAPLLTLGEQLVRASSTYNGKGVDFSAMVKLLESMNNETVAYHKPITS